MNEEEALVDLKLAFVEAVKLPREKHRLSQGVLAFRMNASQSRVAKTEPGNPTVSPASFDLTCVTLKDKETFQGSFCDSA